MTNTINSVEIEHQTNLKGYIIFLIGQWISILGSNIVQFGIIWFLTIETGSPFVLALGQFLGFAPFILVTPVAGVFIDRWSRKKVIMFVDFVQAFLGLVLILIFASGLFSALEMVVVILVITFFRGIFGAFHTAGVDTLLPLLVPKKHLSRINGINYLANGAILIVGPIIGAIALEFFHLKDLLWLDVVTFLIAIIPTAIIFIPKITRVIQEDRVKPSFRAEFTEGLTFIRENSALLALLVVFTSANFFISPLFTQLPIVITAIHFGEAEHLALLFALQQAGLIIGSTIMSTWKGFSNHARGVFIGIFIMYLGIGIFALAPPGTYLVLAIGILFTGFALPLANVSSETIWAKTVPKELLGRVYAVRRTVAQISGPVSILLSGFLAEFIGVIPILLMCSVLGIFILGYSWFFTAFPSVELRLQEKADEVSASTPVTGDGN
ncbi:MAG: MFS transporter [Candidatus Hodarchaeota archaeon]